MVKNRVFLRICCISHSMDVDERRFITGVLSDCVLIGLTPKIPLMKVQVKKCFPSNYLRNGRINAIMTVYLFSPVAHNIPKIVDQLAYLCSFAFNKRINTDWLTHNETHRLQLSFSSVTLLASTRIVSGSATDCANCRNLQFFVPQIKRSIEIQYNYVQRRFISYFTDLKCEIT